MDSKNEWQQKLADRKLHALQCARARDQWSSGLQLERESRYLAELLELRQQVEGLTAERDNTRHQAQVIKELQEKLIDLTAERDHIGRRLAAMAGERDAARQKAATRVADLERQVAALTAERGSASGYLKRIDGLPGQVSDMAAQRDAAKRRNPRQACAVAAPLTAKPATFRRLVPRTATAAGIMFALGILASAVTFQDAQSTVQSERQPAALAGEMAASFKPLVPHAGATSDKPAGQPNDPPPPQTRKPKTRFAKTNRSTHQQWAPPLQMSDLQAGETTQVFDPLVQKQQQNLLALGFDVGKADGFNGPRTRQALDEFKSLYLSGASLKEPISGAALTAITSNYADLARDDAGRFDVDQGVLAAIRLSSVRSGIDFSYLLKLAAVESNFDPRSRADGSSATGLYQFTRETWLNTVKAHGDKYGLAAYATRIEYIVDADGYRRPVVRDKAIYQHLLDLRTNPRVSAMMAAESVRDNLQKLTLSFDRAPSQADLYLTHFLGTDGAISFLKALDETPDALAVEMFPAAAQSNQDIFHPKTCRPRTVDEVYALFGQKFSTARYDLVTY